MAPAVLVAEYEDGNDIGWAAEFEWLWLNHGEQMLELVRDIAVNGIREPVMLGLDGSIWDGHHRIAAACALRLSGIPVASPNEIEADRLSVNDES